MPATSLFLIGLFCLATAIALGCLFDNRRLRPIARGVGQVLKLLASAAR